MQYFALYSIVLLLLCCEIALAGTKSKRHGHDGVLPAFSGKHIGYKISLDDAKTLEKGNPVFFTERIGQSGRGFVLQDIEASPEECMDRIRDLANYPKMVPKVKKVNIYNSEKFSNGTEKMQAEISAGVFLLSINYYLSLTFQPTYYTLTWTLDYQYNSDFDDSIGLWQVMPHPIKSGWTRVLYSTEVKLFPWVPDAVVNFLTKSALTESTGWVKKEAEKLHKIASTNQYPRLQFPDLQSCYVKDDQHFVYLEACVNSAFEGPHSEL